MFWPFLAAYTCSGLAGLVYEVAWTRQLTLHLGHTTAAASTVVGAFLLGLAGGAALAGRWAERLTPRQALGAYAGLELAVAAWALALPWQLTALTPLLRWAYHDGDAAAVFSLVRLASCAPMVLLPALALGATFPLAIRGIAATAVAPARRAAALYAANTAGAAAGALLAGFVLVPELGLRGTAAVGMTASVVSAAAAWWISRLVPATTARAADAPEVASPARSRRRAAPHHAAPPPAPPGRLRRATLVLGLSGFAALAHELAWTRVLAMALGPTTYAFAAALAAVIAGTAAGSWLGTWALARTPRPAGPLAVLLAAAAATMGLTFTLAGGPLPLFVAERIRAAPEATAAWMTWSGWATALLVVPTAACLGAAFPFGLALAGASTTTAAGRFGLVYAANTLGAVAGSVAAGFVLIPWLGLQGTLQTAGALLVLASIAAVAGGGASRPETAGAALVTLAAFAALTTGARWDRALLAGGGYLYAPFVPADLDLGTMLRAGTVQYYAEGAAATIAVKRLTGTTTLTVDGKTDASNRGDMLTQKLAAHLPLLLHDAPRDVAIVGLGSGVTVGAALTHPVTRVDVVELSPEVVAASSYFAVENRHALADPRTRLILGDGRAHLLLARRRYDVIVSEPSNPWIAGVASLFTREFFMAARQRLAAGGVLCQWANAYNIGADDLRAIVATFLAAFPGGAAFLVGEHDVLLIGATPRDGETTDDVRTRLAAIAAHWRRPGVAADLALVAAEDPAAVQSLYVGGAAELARYAGEAPVFADDRITLEFTAPREIHRRSGAQNGAVLRGLLADADLPPPLAAARAAAGAAGWMVRGAMFAAADVHPRAYDDFLRALGLDPDDRRALDGFVRAAVLLRRGDEALSRLASVTTGRADTAAHAVARSKLLAASGRPADARTAAAVAAALAPADLVPLEQLAAVEADAGDVTRLEAVVATMRRLPPHPTIEYYAAVARLLRDDPAGALEHAERCLALDRSYAAVYDLAGAALTRLDRPDRARDMFERSLTFDAHDSTAYTNLGLLDLAAGHQAPAANRFAEALWLDPASATARAGLARALAR